MFDQNLFQIQEHFRSQNKNLELAILDQKIQVSPEGKIVLQVVGHVQEEIAEKMRPELLRMIRQLSGATQVSILVEQAEEVADDRPKLYTNTDKLRYLKEKHPALAEFQRKFGLEVDF
jgi:nitrate reductase NapAB chaperone NapD